MNYAQPPMMPVAKALANQGRMTDSTLVHMNPQEVAGLQSLARQNGTSLTINPQTGLPEAFNLGSILPVIAGAALTPIMGPVGAAMTVGGLGTLMSGSIEQGLMMGLGAYGGAGLAGSAANLAAPATMAASAPTTAAIAAPSAMGTTGIMASAAPATTLAGATQFAPAASVGGLGLQAPALSAITPATTAAAGSSLVPTATGGLAATAAPSLQATAPFATATPIADVIPSAAPSSISPPSGIGRLFQPDERTTYENIGTGLKKAFSSGESAMDFLGQNKMNLAMSAAPMLLSPEEEAEIERQRAMIRPYEYQVDNLSGTDVDPFGVERERLRGRFVAKTPYYAAKGGLMSLAEGGSTSGSTTTAPTAQPGMSSSEADVMARIAAVQQMAGLPMGMPTSPAAPPAGIAGLPNPFTMAPPAPRAPVAYTPSMVGTTSALDTSEKRYGATPTTGSVVGSGSGDFMSSLPLEDTSVKGILMSEGMPGLINTVFDVNRLSKGVTPDPSNLREARRIVGYTGDGKPVFLASGATGGVSTGTSRNKFSYDPATGTYTRFAEGGSVAEGSSTTEAPTAASTQTLTLTPAQAEVFRNIFAVQQMVNTPVAPSAGIAALPTSFMMLPAAPRAPVAYTPSTMLDTSEKRYAGSSETGPVVDTSKDFTSSLPLEKVGKLRYTPIGRIAGMMSGKRLDKQQPRRIVGYTGEGEPVYLASDDKGGTVSGASNKFSYDPATGRYTQLAGGGLTTLAQGGVPMLKKGRFLDDTTDSTGNSDGMSDSMPGVINGEQPARLTDGEFVVPADVVSHLGNGSSKAGAKRLHNMMDRIRKARTGTKKQAPAVKAEKYMPA